ncbi:MAG: hypothetical protein ACNFW9_01555 [Candidatus Kerfeldbacteria bacterium]
MEDTNLDQKISGKRERSTAYPAISLEDAITYSEKLILAYPRHDFDRESAVKAMGFNSISGASAPKVAALVHYGLLERGKGSTYKNTDLAERICNYEEEQEKNEAIREAVMRPKLFNSLINDYTNRAIPVTLNNVLIRQYKISSKVSDNAVQTFKDSVEFAGIYQNGVLNDSAGELKGQNMSNVQAEPEKKPSISGLYSVPLPSGAVVSYPSDIAFYLQTNEDYTKALESLEKVVRAALIKKNEEIQPNGDVATE